eukprot:scaffold4072_cov61-Phaeocystis_antarctica.AAC.2
MYRAPSAISSWYVSPVCAARRATCSAASRSFCCCTPPSSLSFCTLFSCLWYAACSFQAPGLPGHLTQHQYVVGTFCLTHLGHTGCFSRSSSISDGSLAQPKHARLSATFGAAPPLLAAGGTAAAAGGTVAALASLRLQRVERLANLPGARSQLGEQRLEAEVGISDAHSTHCLEEGVGRAGFAHAMRKGVACLLSSAAAHWSLASLTDHEV